jgi:hypothetical protein
VSNGLASRIRLLRPVCALIAAFTLLVVATRLLGSGLPPPQNLAELRLDQCALPCWVGITLGETRFEDAIQRVSAAFGGATFTSAYGTSVIAAYQVGSTRGQVALFADAQGRVQQISFLTSNIDGVSVGDVAGWLGAPTCGSSRPVTAVYRFGATSIVLGSARRDAGWRAPLNNIEFRADTGDLQPCAAAR